MDMCIRRGSENTEVLNLWLFVIKPLIGCNARCGLTGQMIIQIIGGTDCLRLEMKR